MKRLLLLVVSLTVVVFLAAGHALVQNIRRGHCELATGIPARHRLRIAFGQLATAI